MKIKIAILDSDQNYINKLMNTFNQSYADKVEVYSFTKLETALESIKNTKIDLFIADESYEVEEFLDDIESGFAYMVSSADIELLREQRTICKYQRVELIYKDILDIYSETEAIVMGIKPENRDCKIISFLSVVNGAGTTCNAIACARYLTSLGKKVLYLDMDILGNTSLYFEGEGKFGLSDILYTIKSKKPNFHLKLESTVKEDITGVFYYESVNSPLDMLEFKEEEIVLLLKELENSGTYNYIIIDMPFNFMKKSYAMMNNSDSIVTVTDGTETGNDKLIRFYASMSILDKQKDTRLLDRLYVIYNKFSNKTGKEITIGDLRILGGILRFENPVGDVKQIIDQLSSMPLYKKLL